MTEADKKLMEVYGDTVHLNDGRHLHGGIDAATDEKHIKWFDLVVAHPHKLYFPPRCKVGKKFISMLAGLLRGVIDRRWNSEYPLIFAACILRRNQGTFKAAQIKKRIAQRLALWEEGRSECREERRTPSSLKRELYRERRNRCSITRSGCYR